MASTQKNGNGNDKKQPNNHNILRPLNIGPHGAHRQPRRSSEEARQSRIDKEKKQAEKALKRANKLAELQAVALKRAEEAKKRAESIAAEEERKRKEAEEKAKAEAEQRQKLEADSKRRSEATSEESTSGDETPVKVDAEMQQTLTNIGKEFQKFFSYIQQAYGITFSGPEPALVKRGFISVKMRGDLPATKNKIEVSDNPMGAGREAARFMAFYKQVGLDPSWLNKEFNIKDDPNKYMLTGLRGKAHSVVLRKVGTNEAFTMSPDNFKKIIVQ